MSAGLRVWLVWMLFATTAIRENDSHRLPAADCDYLDAEEDVVFKSSQYLLRNAAADEEEDVASTEWSEQDILDMIRSGQLRISTAAADDELDEAATVAWDDEEELPEDSDRSTKKRPWRKVKRILRRQLVKKPTRYLLKLIRKVGLKRQLRSAASRAGPVYKGADVQEVGILMNEHGAIGALSNGRFSAERLKLLKS